MLIQLRAWTPSVLQLPIELAARLAATGLVEAKLSRAPDQLELVPGSRVGVAVGTDWELRVMPRISIRQLMFLLSHGREDGWLDGTAEYSDDDLFAAVADGFSRQALQAVTPTPLFAYEPIEETAMVLRGRLRLGAQLAARGAMPIPLEIAYDEFSMNIPENQVLLGAVELLLRWPRVDARSRARLMRVRGALDGVVPRRPSRRVSIPSEDRRNLRYRQPLALAKLILEGQSPTANLGHTASSTFSFDMNRVFEDFVGDLLEEAAIPLGLRIIRQDRAHHLDVEEGLRLKPDFVVRRGVDVVAVLDAKYKSLAGPGIPNADAYQLLAYCTAYGLDRATLLYGEDRSAVGERLHRVVAGGPTLRVEVIDLNVAAHVIRRNVREVLESAVRLPVLGSAS